MRKRSRIQRLMLEAVCALVRLAVGAYPAGQRIESQRQAIYFANHTSHLDTLVLLAALPMRARQQTRPVAARDYWCAGRLRHWFATTVLDVVFVDRDGTGAGDPLDPLRGALEAGSSLILFPEGTRTQQELPGEFKSGLFWLSRDFPDVLCTPIYLENLHRILPKGTLLPVPLINRVHFGAPLLATENYTKGDFLNAARSFVVQLCPTRNDHH